MPNDPLDGRFTPQDPPPVVDDPPVDPAVQDPPADPGATPVQPPATPPAVEAVDPKGVPYKNRFMEANRKLDKQQRRTQQLEQELAVLRGEVNALKAAPAVTPAAPAAQPTQPANNQPPSARRSYDVKVLEVTPLNEWPEEALRDLKAQDPAKWAADVDEILDERQTARVTSRVELKQQMKTMDARILSAYPDMQDRESSLYDEVRKVTREWGVNLKQSPLALEGIVKEAAERIGLRPRVVTVNRPDRRDGAVAPPDGEPGGRTGNIPSPPAPQVTLTAEQKKNMEIFGVKPDRYMAEVARTNTQPLVSAGSGEEA